MRSILLLFMFILISLSIKAQNEVLFDYENPYEFKGSQLIAPLSLIALGTTSLYINAVGDFDVYMQDLIASGHGKATFDDYWQYSPVVLMWMLDAAGVKSRHRFKEQTTNLAISALSMGIMVNGGKYIIKRQRPNNGTYNSLPSGHTSMAFMGAEFLRMEFWETSPWIGVAGYALATTTAYMRVYNNRHWVTDTVVGAGVGILSVKIAYWLAPVVNRWIWGSDLEANHSAFEGSLSPYVSSESVGASLSMRF